MTTWVRITTDHIRKAMAAEPRQCPAELAVKTTTGRDHVRITGPECVYVEGVAFEVVQNSRFMLGQFLEGISQGKYVRCFTFGVDYDPKRLGEVCYN